MREDLAERLIHALQQDGGDQRDVLLLLQPGDQLGGMG